jgi:hypothetical protein
VERSFVLIGGNEPLFESGEMSVGRSVVRSQSIRNRSREALDNAYAICYDYARTAGEAGRHVNKGGAVMRLSVMERELAKWFSLPPRQPRRRRLTKREVAGFALDGYLEYLYGLTGEERERAEKLLAEFCSTSEEETARSILEWAERLLTSSFGARGQRMFRWLRARAPEQLGRVYAIYRVFGNQQWALEELAEEYEYSRRGDY